jgi:hypothetical protein
MEKLNLHEIFTESSWDGNLEGHNSLLLVPTSPEAGKKAADSLESYLVSHGFSSAESDDPMVNQTMPGHFNLVGIDGWKVDFINRTFVRLDDFTVRWTRTSLRLPTEHSSMERIRVSSFTQLDHALDHHHGSIHAKRYNI